eukprot:1674763-Amphidinium_carterae.1
MYMRAQVLVSNMQASNAHMAEVLDKSDFCQSVKRDSRHSYRDQQRTLASNMKLFDGSCERTEHQRRLKAEAKVQELEVFVVNTKDTHAWTQAHTIMMECRNVLTSLEVLVVIAPMYEMYVRMLLNAFDSNLATMLPCNRKLCCSSMWLPLLQSYVQASWKCQRLGPSMSDGYRVEVFQPMPQQRYFVFGGAQQ